MTYKTHCLCKVLQFLLVMLLFLAEVYCRGAVEVNLSSISNMKGLQANGSCCDGDKVNGSCVGKCQTFFSLCLAYITSLPGSSCKFGSTFSPVLGNNSFTIPSGSTERLLRIPFTLTWPGAFSLTVEARDDDTTAGLVFQGSSATSDLIERIVIKRYLNPGPSWQNLTHLGTIANVSLSYRVVCSLYYYGNGCSKYCEPRDDANGHYSCDVNGDVQCLPGWRGTWCTEVICKPGCEHGTCYIPNTCRCHADSGWTGENCTECVPYPGCANGTCSKPWECNCAPGWSGILCDIEINYCSKHSPCVNGTCFNSGNGDYYCKCLPGYTGKECHIEIDECASNPCKNGGICTDLIGSFKCSCTAGFTGPLCKNNINDCHVNKCLNGGSCIDGIDTFTCQCRYGYTGRLCEHVMSTPTTATTVTPTFPNNSSVTTQVPTENSEQTPTDDNDVTVDSKKQSSVDDDSVPLKIVIVIVVIVVAICLCCGLAWKFWRRITFKSCCHRNVTTPDQNNLQAPEVIINFLTPATKSLMSLSSISTTNLGKDEYMKNNSESRKSLELSTVIGNSSTSESTMSTYTNLSALSFSSLPNSMDLNSYC